MFDTITDDTGQLVTAGRFRCGLCNTMGVDEAGELCPACADHVLTQKCRYARPADAEKTAKRAPRKPRKTAAASKSSTTATTSTPRQPRKAAAARKVR